MQKIYPVINRLLLASPPVSTSTPVDTSRRAAGLTAGLVCAAHLRDQTAREGRS